MKSPPNLALVSTIIGTLALAVEGCHDPDHRLADLASQATHDQAEQNKRVAEGTKAIAEGSKGLVEADAEARRELIELQHLLRQDQAEVGRHRDVLEAERKAINGQRRTESQIASGLVILGVVLACLSPLILAGFCLLGLWREPSREEEGEVLLDALVNMASLPASETPSLPPPHPRPPGLPSAEGSDPS
jgi:hypothetical protein